MRKIITIMLLLATVSLHAQTKLIWADRAEIGIGYSYYHATPAKDDYGNTAPRNIIAMDVRIKGLYFSVALMEKSTGYDVYGWDEVTGTAMLKVGPSLDVWKFGTEPRINITPFVGFANMYVKDDSNNDIGHRQKYGSIGFAPVIGGRVSAKLSNRLALAGAISNKDAALTLNLLF